MRNTWDLNYLCDSKEVWQQRKEQLDLLIHQLEIELEHCNSIESIETVLRHKIEMNQQIETIYCYPKRMLDLDSENWDAKEMFEIALAQYTETQKIDTLFVQRMKEHSQLVMQFLEKNPYYQRYFDLLFQDMEHPILNQDEYYGLQDQLNMLKEIYQSLVRRDLDFGEIEDEEGNIVKATPMVMQKLSDCDDQEVRARSFFQTMKTYQGFENTLSTIYYRKLKAELRLEQCRGFSSILEAHLFQDSLPSDIVSNLISSVKKNLEIQHQFYSFKKERLGVKEYHLYDMNKTSVSGFQRDFSLEEAQTIIHNMTGILGPDYQKRLEEAFLNGWLDLTLSKTKRKDSFSCITYSGVPYTMLQYKEKIDSVRILSHELGHAIHTSYAKENGFEYFEYPLFLAEIASKVNEALFYHYMLEQNIEEEEKQFIIEHMVQSFCTSLFSQTMLTEFESTVLDRIGKKERVDATYLHQLYLSLARSYYGKDVTIDDLVGVNWTKIAHFFLYPSYYVFQYATGVAIANKIAFDLILDQNGMRQKYIEFLKVGNRKSIREALNLVGIDLESQTYIDDACQFVKSKMKVLK